MRVSARKASRGSAAAWLLGGVIVVGLGVAVTLAVLYTGPEARARADLEKARELEAGTPRRWEEAAQLYVAVARSETESAAEGVAGLAKALQDRMQVERTFHGVEAIRFAADVDPPVLDDPLVPLLAGIEIRARNDVSEALSLLWHLRKNFPAAAERLAPLRRAMLVDAVQRHPDVTNHAVELAELLDRDDQREEAVALLTPHRDALGDGEGARILGLADLARGDVTAALNLLRPYVKAGVPRVTDLEEQYSKRYDELADEELARLNDGVGPQTLFDAWEAASEDDRPVIIDRHLDAVVQAHPDIVDMRRRYDALSQVVPIALEVGALLLDGALTLPEGIKRRAALEQAEGMFLSVRQVASNQVRVRSQLGQVYFWLGRQDDGRAEFDGLLTDENRSTEALLEVSEVYRELGLTDEALVLAREAWEGTDNESRRQQAARQVSLIVTDSDERITWLERSDQGSPTVRATLAEIRADKAEAEGDIEAAKRYLEEALAIHESLPPNDTNHNNAALAASSLLQLAPDDALRSRARHHIEEAVRLSPSNAIVLSNAADMLEVIALEQFVVDRIGLAQMDWGGELAYLPSLWRTDAERDAVLAELDAAPGMKTFNAVVGRVVLLRPEDRFYYRLAANYYEMREDADALARLANLYRQAGLAEPPDQAGARSFYLGPGTEEAREARERRYQGWADGYEEQREGHSPPLSTAVLTEYVAAARRAARFALGVDGSAVLAAARAEHAAAGSALSRRLLVDSMLLNAFVDFRAGGVLDERMAQCTACYSPDDLVALLAAERSPLGDRVREHPDVQGAASLVAESLAGGTRARSLSEWALLSVLEPGAASTARSQLTTTASDRAAMELDLLRYPSSVLAHTSHALLAALEGDAGPAQAVQEEVGRWGLKLPVDLGLIAKGVGG